MSRYAPEGRTTIGKYACEHNLRLHVRTVLGRTHDHREDTMFTPGTHHGMGLADTHPRGSPLMPGRTRDRHRTAPRSSRVNGRARPRRNGRRQRDLFCVRDGIPANKKKNRQSDTANGNLPYLINDGRYHLVE